MSVFSFDLGVKAKDVITPLTPREPGGPQSTPRRALGADGGRHA